MPVFETYAKRRKAEAKSGAADVFTYEDVPDFLRRQIATIFKNTFGGAWADASKTWWNQMDRILSQEIETYPQASPYGATDAASRCLKFINEEPDIDNWLSIIEMACTVFSGKFKDDYNVTLGNRGAIQKGPDAVTEINTIASRGVV